VDQYVAVTYSLEYTTRVTSKTGWQLILVTWALGLLTASMGSVLSVGARSPWRSCRLSFEPASGNVSYWLPTAHVVLSCWLPLTALAIIYLRIFCAARMSSVKARKTSLAHRPLPTAASAASMGRYEDEEEDEEGPEVDVEGRRPAEPEWAAEEAIREYCQRVARTFNQSRLSTIGSISSPEDEEEEDDKPEIEANSELKANSGRMLLARPSTCSTATTGTSATTASTGSPSPTTSAKKVRVPNSSVNQLFCVRPAGVTS